MVGGKQTRSVIKPWDDGKIDRLSVIDSHVLGDYKRTLTGLGKDVLKIRLDYLIVMINDRLSTNKRHALTVQCAIDDDGQQEGRSTPVSMAVAANHDETAVGKRRRRGGTRRMSTKERLRVQDNLTANATNGDNGSSNGVEGASTDDDKLTNTGSSQSLAPPTIDENNVVVDEENTTTTAHNNIQELANEIKQSVEREFDALLTRRMNDFVKRLEETNKFTSASTGNEHPSQHQYGFTHHRTHMKDKALRRRQNDSDSSSSASSSNYLPEKVFVYRNSVLTDLLAVPHIRGLYHICIALLVIVTGNSLINDIIDHGSLIHSRHWELVKFTFGGFHYVIVGWLGMILASALIPFVGVRLWLQLRPKPPPPLQKDSQKPLVLLPIDWLMAGTFVIFETLLAVLPALFIIRYELPPASTIIIATEQIRLFMKSYAFVRSAIGDELAAWQNREDGKKIDATASETVNIQHSLSHYVYFLFAPTLVYRASYPRTTSIRWTYVLTNFLQVIACLVLSYSIFVRFCFNQFADFAKPQGISISQLISTSTACTIPGGIVMFLVFFAALHSWFNAWAELLKFGDRLFYKDWWNATNFSTWYRTWNVVVHDWLYTYVYRDIQRMGAGNSVAKLIASACVFWMSAVVHEYVLSISLRFCFPVLYCFFTLPGFCLFYIRGNGRIWNVLLWLMLFVGWGQMMCLYSMEWYARRHCKPIMPTSQWLNFFIPHSMFCQTVEAKAAED